MGNSVAPGCIKRFLLGAFLLLAWATIAAADQTPRRFDLAAGSAEGALNEFAVQTGLQVLYPTDLTMGVQTNAVRGHYTVREALDRLLSDTGLSAKYNEQTGIIEIARAQPRKESVVRLPPYTVEGESVPWRYARVGNIEVLSACMDDVTRRVIQQLFQLHEAVGLVIPPDLLFETDTPNIYVLHSDADKAAVPQELLDKLRQREQKSGQDSAAITWNIGIMSSYIFWDVDSRGIYFILNEGAFMVGRLSIRGDYLRALLTRRTPALPNWFVEGVMDLYPTITFDPYGATSYSLDNRNRHRMPGGIARVDPFVWVSPDASMAIRKGHRPELVPMADLISGPWPGTRDPRRAEWKAQAALFVRWALDVAKNGREGLWQLARLSDKKQPTEKDFENCFGLTYSEVETALRHYLPKAIRRDFELRPKHFAETPEYSLRLATEMDVALIKGDLDRLKIDYVRRFAPKLTQRYIEQARTTLKRGYGMGDTPPQLAGLLGLCECDVGDDMKARPWLEQAVAGGVIRPRVYYELARIRFNAAKAQSKDGALSDRELEPLLSLLRTSSQHHPPLLASYELMADILAASHPVAYQLDELRQGLSYFPRQSGLIAAVVRVYRQNGREAEAQKILDHGLAMITDPTERSQLLKLDNAH